MCLAAAAALAQDQRPLPAGTPEALVHPTMRVHVVADEELDPDRLRGLARPSVTLWLRSRSGVLRESTLENLARFDEAWVQVRLRQPVGPQLRQLARAPRVGAWLDAAELTGELSLPVRAVAIDVGALDPERAALIASARPAVVRWRPPEPPQLLAWALFHQLPGRRIYAPAADQLLATRCATREPGSPSLEVHVAALLALSSDGFPCGPGTRVVVEPTVDRWLVQSLLVRDPSVELVVEVGADELRASKARALLQQLGFAASR